MTDDQLKYADFCIEKVLNASMNTCGINTKFQNITRDEAQRVLDILVDEGFLDKDMNHHKIGSYCFSMIDEYGSYSNFKKSKNKHNDRQKEIEELNIKLNQLQIDNLEYQTTLRTKNEKIASLDLRLKRFEFIQKWWWLIGIILIILGFVIRHLEIFQYLIQLL
jgi:hypothetical protein